MKEALLERMCDLSEAHWSAGWLYGTEYALWSMVLGGPRTWGNGEVSPAEIDDLRSLSEQADGWYVWDDAADPFPGPNFLPLAEWKTLYATRKSE